MGQMPEAISRIIDATEAYTNEITVIENQIAKLQNLLAKFMERPNSENWPRIYMIGRCSKFFSTCHYNMLGEDYVEHDIEPGKYIRFHYDYETGSFKEDFNFLTQRELFRYEKYRDNFDIVAYIALPNVVKKSTYSTPGSDWPRELSLNDNLSTWVNILQEARISGRLYIVSEDKDV